MSDHDHGHDDHGHEGLGESLSLRIGAVFIFMVVAMLGTLIAPLIMVVVKKCSSSSSSKKDGDEEEDAEAEHKAELRASLMTQRAMRLLAAFSVGIIIGTAMLHLIPEASEMLKEGGWGEDDHAAHASHAATTPTTSANATTATAGHDDHDHDDNHHDDDHNTTTATTTAATNSSANATHHDDDHNNTATTNSSANATHHDDHDDDHHDDDDHGNSTTTNSSSSAHDDHDHDDDHAAAHSEEEEGHNHAFPYALLIAVCSSILLYIFEHELHALLEYLGDGKKKEEAEESDNNQKTLADPSSGNDQEENAGGDKTATTTSAVPIKQSEEEKENHAADEERRSVTAHVVGAALCVHSLILGLTVGLLTTTSTIRALVIAVALDQFADGVAVGSSLVQATRLSMCQQIFVRLIFGFASGIGTAVGIIIDQAGGTRSLIAQGFLAAVSGGLLLVMAYTNMLSTLVTKPFTHRKRCASACAHTEHPEHLTTQEEIHELEEKERQRKTVAEESGSEAAEEEVLLQYEVTLPFRIVLYIFVAGGFTVMALLAKYAH